MKKSIINDKSYKFALRVVKLYKYLIDVNKEYVISKQILRSGTSIGANVEEAYYAQSKKDFISKMSIALKEAAETKYWLRLLKDSNSIKNNKKVDNLILECEEIIKILTSILNTAKKKST
ncbi:four helix bundle protein [Caminicella sporogenes DSM 14501]|uniref:Four helix bundle protein n=1 Tax=Caminicella sporogenes DSM 14501 TaxID=1121266 RepID=A0A1M6Q1V3_9FIRM|nr:four helix bundle protein [Caminicella sporogenes]RKD23543.1 four helix bundle protein [Caminicella sporogenes]SHK14091.1 four helix bundle protein [Caminicella sporogenes DSM 14501]